MLYPNPLRIDLLIPEKKGNSKFIVIFIFIIFSTITAFGQQNINKKFSPEESLADFKYLYETLVATTYDLFLFTDKEIFDREYNKIIPTISDSLSLLEINRIFQQFVALTDFSHCHINFPMASYRQFFKNGGSFFPLEINFVNKEPVIAVDYSMNTNITVGDRLLSIEGISIDQVLKKIYSYISGENIYTKSTMVEYRSFRDLFWFAAGDFSKGNITVKKSAGDTLNVQIRGVLLSELISYIKSHPQRPSFTNSKREVKFIGETAYLHPGIFLNNKILSRDISDHSTFNTDEFHHFMDSAFTMISNKEVTDLIIDIRGNDGGDNSFSDYMIAFFADKPFGIASKFQIRTSQITKKFWQNVDNPKYENLRNQILNLKNGERFEADLGQTLPRNDSLRFKGQVYILINRYSFSNAAVVAAIVQDYRFGVVIGEETSYVPSSCGAVHEFNLPNTNINVIYPKAYSIRPNGDTSLRGVIPDHIVLENLFTDSDEIMNYTINLINN